MNAYEMLELLRDNLNEASPAVHQDINLVRRLNRAQNKLAMVLSVNGGGWLKKSAEVVPVDGVIQLPVDCSKPVYLEEKDEESPVDWLLSVSHKAFSPGKEAYSQQRTLVVNTENFSTTCILYYELTPPDLVVANNRNLAASGTDYLTLPDDLNTKRVSDYYKDVYFEIVGGTGAGLIVQASAYAPTTRRVTVDGEFGLQTVFGSVSVLPSEIHGMIVLEATASALGKPSTNVDGEVFKRFFAELREERNMMENWIASQIPGATNSVLIGDEY